VVVQGGPPGEGAAPPHSRDLVTMVTQFREAIGKLRRLETLELLLSMTGNAYHLIAQGMAKGGCPVLRSLTCTMNKGAAGMGHRPSLILPSVQHLSVVFTRPTDGAEPLAMAHALTSLGYRGSVVMVQAALDKGQQDQIRAILQPGVSVRFQ
jgi:hypothetical protein